MMPGRNWGATAAPTCVGGLVKVAFYPLAACSWDLTLAERYKDHDSQGFSSDASLKFNTCVGLTIPGLCEAGQAWQTVYR